MGKLIDLTGKKFGRLTVIERTENNHRGNVMWKCICECGNEKIVSRNCLNQGITKSCGCLLKEARHSNTRKHGKTKTRLYRIWAKMKERCNNPKTKSFVYYGGRGITICEEWLNDFQAFYDWSMANGYSDNLSIDRIDVNGNYEPGNCRWADTKTQANNKTTNRYITLNNKTQTLQQWSKETGINHSTIQVRIDEMGWTKEQAIKSQVRGKYTFNGKTQSLEEWANELGIKRRTLLNRMSSRKMTLEEAFTEPLRNKVYTFNDKTLTLKEWADELNVKYATLKNRLYKRKWTIEKTLTEPVKKRTTKK